MVHKTEKYIVPKKYEKDPVKGLIYLEGYSVGILELRSMFKRKKKR